MTQASTKLALKITDSSRYKDTPLTARTVDGIPPRREWALWVSDPSFRRSTDFQVYQVTDADVGRLDLISYRFYGVPLYWWIIADANDIVNPVTDMYLGMFIKVPNRLLIDRFIQRSARS